jgi:hypothetical protein
MKETPKRPQTPIRASAPLPGRSKRKTVTVGRVPFHFEPVSVNDTAADLGQPLSQAFDGNRAAFPSHAQKHVAQLRKLESNAAAWAQASEPDKLARCIQQSRRLLEGIKITA